LTAYQNVLVTGGAGFIGSHLVDRLVAARKSVTVVDNLSSGRESNLNGFARFEKADIRSPEMRDILARVRPELIFHTAAQISVAVSAREPVLDADVNVMGSLNLMEAASQSGTRKVVYVSTGGAMYGDPERLPADESLPARPLSPYGASKLAFENYLPVFKALHGIHYAIVRPANVYGPRQDPHGEAGVVAIFTRAMLEGRPCKIFGTGDDERDYLYVEDLADLLVRAAEGEGTGPYNGGTGAGTSVNTLFMKLARLCNYTQPPVKAPPRPGDLARISLDSSKARRDLGWRPEVTLDEGFSRTVEWFKANPEKRAS
jgi:UDP-glucose 4-epimerase